jgi:AraC-like DNA-binding protein/quercetin dioxygenase-like cupin family protein
MRRARPFSRPPSPRCIGGPPAHAVAGRSCAAVHAGSDAIGAGIQNLTSCALVSEISHQPVSPTQQEFHAAGDIIARHRHDDHQLIYVSTGVLAIQTDQGAWVASSGRAIWVPAQTWHEHRIYGQSSVHVVGFPLTDPPLLDSAPTVVAVAPLLRELLIAYTESDVTDPEARRLRGVLTDRLRRAHIQPLNLPTAQDPRLADACRLVVDHLSEPRTLAWLSHQVGAGERTLTRLFRTEFGMTYPQWRTTTRIFHAMILLADGQSVTQTARACGWATTSAFVDSFARTMGQTPGSYRSAATASRST